MWLKFSSLLVFRTLISFTKWKLISWAVCQIRLSQQHLATKFESYIFSSVTRFNQTKSYRNVLIEISYAAFFSTLVGVESFQQLGKYNKSISLEVESEGNENF